MEEDPPKVTLESVDSRSGFILLKHKKSDLTSKKIKKEQAIALLDEKPEELKKRKADMVFLFPYLELVSFLGEKLLAADC